MVEEESIENDVQVDYAQQAAQAAQAAASRQKYFENWLQFVGSEVINPKSEDFFQFLNRDSDLGNIDDAAWHIISERIAFANQLLSEGFVKPAMRLFSECQTMLVTSRSRGGFQQNILITQNQQQKQTLQQEIKQSAPGGSGGILGLFKKRR